MCPLAILRDIMIGMKFALACCLAAVATLASAQEPGLHDHEPRYGGVLFPAAGDTVHIEGVWAEQRRFKLFVFDPAGRLLTIDRLRAVVGRVVVGTRAFPLELQPGERVLEARIPTLQIPAQLSVQASLSPGGPEEGFAFMFPGYSDESRARGEGVSTANPPTLSDVLAAMRDDRRNGQVVLDSGEFVAVSIPVDRIRARLLELDTHLLRLPADARARAQETLVHAVRAAWLLHTATDYGVSAQVSTGFAALGIALDDVEAVFAPAAR